MSQLTDHLDRTIVIIDDSPRFTAIVRGMLRDFGFTRVHDFSDPRQAFLHATRMHVDLVLTELYLEPITGLQFVDRIRHADVVVNRVLPIILMTAQAGRPVIQKAIEHGVDEVLVKPFSSRHLHDRLMSVFDKPRVYIKTPTGYFGPDRRRRQDPNYLGPERRRANSAVVITEETLLEMRAAARKKYGRLPPSPLEPKEIAPLLVGPITTIPVTAIALREGNKVLPQVPTSLRRKAEEERPLPESATAAQVMRNSPPTPIAPRPEPTPPTPDAEVHFLD